MDEAISNISMWSKIKVYLYIYTVCSVYSNHLVVEGLNWDVFFCIFARKKKSSKWINIKYCHFHLEFGLFNYILILVSGMVLFAVAMETCGISYVLPMSECDMNLSTSDEGILTAVPFAGIICSSHLWGFLADTKGRRRVLQPTLLAAFLISVASSFVQNFYLFTTLRFLNGFLWVIFVS